jgi:hypothetical protein
MKQGNKEMKQGNLLQFGNRILPEGETVMMTSTRVMMTRRVRLPFGCCASKLCLGCTLMMHSGLMQGRGKGGKGGAVRGWKRQSRWLLPQKYFHGN